MKFGVREICDVVFKTTDARTIGTRAFAQYEPVLYIDTAKTSTMEGAATTVYATGGKGNSRLLAWEGEKTLTFTVEDALISPLSFSILSGAGLADATGTGISYHMTTEAPYNTATSVIVTKALADITTTGYTVLDPTGTNTKAYGTVVDDAGAVVRSLGPVTSSSGTLDAAGVTFNWSGATILSTEKVVVDYYVSKTGGTVRNITITPDQFAGYYYVEASTLFRDQNTGADYPAEFIIPKAKIQSNFTFTMAATGDPSTFSFVMDAFPGKIKGTTTNVLAAIQVLE